MRVLVILSLAACGRVSFDPADLAADASADSAVVLGPWGNAGEIPELNIGAINDDPTLTVDELELYFNSNRDGTGDIFVSTRSSTAAPWGAPQKVVVLSSMTSNENTPEVSGDGLEIYFIRDTTPSGDVYVSTRVQRTDAWSAPVLVPELTTPFGDAAPTLTSNRLSMYLANDGGPNGFEIYRATRGLLTSAWAAPVAVLELSHPSFDSDAFATDDGLELYWSSNRGATKSALWRGTRDAGSAVFTNLAVVSELDLTTHDEDDAWISTDRRTIYFSRGMTLTQDMKIFRATR